MLTLKSIAHIHAIYASRVRQEFHASDLTFSHLNLINNNDILLETQATFKHTHSQTHFHQAARGQKGILSAPVKTQYQNIGREICCLNMKKERL